MRTLLAIWTTKLLIWAGKLVGKKGSSTPGSIALKICPSLLEQLAKQVRGSIVVVCGTNGKTTSNNLLQSMLSEQGKKVVCNHLGANMLEGVATAFVSNTTLFGKLDADYACLEVDEFSTLKVFAHLSPDIMLITNLFHDQLDRYGTIEAAANALSRAIEMVPDTLLLLNGDDPFVTLIGNRSTNKTVYFGVGQDVGVGQKETNETPFCGVCGNPLDYRFHHYSHLGDYACSSCEFARPDIQFSATDVSFHDGLSFTVCGQQIHLDSLGFYNVYNILAAYSAFCLLGFEGKGASRALSAYQPQIGRMEPFFIGKPVVLNLSKNPAGLNQAVATLCRDVRSKDVVIAMNDNAQDGKDVTWLWDVEFESLKQANVSNFFVSGMRQGDVMVRFKYGEIGPAVACESIKRAIELALESDASVLYVLVNYTALFSTQQLLKEMEAAHEKGALK